MLKELVAFIAGSTLYLVVLGFLSRSIILHFLGKDLEKFKLNLIHETSKHQFVFNRLYEKKLDIVSALYEHSVKAGEAVKYTVQMQGKVNTNRIPELEKRIKGFKEQYEVSRLWLDDDCCNVIDKLVDEHSIFYKIVNAAELEKDGLGKDWIGLEYLNLYKRVEEELPTAQEKLKLAFKNTIKSIKP